MYWAGGDECMYLLKAQAYSFFTDIYRVALLLRKVLIGTNNFKKMKVKKLKITDVEILRDETKTVVECRLLGCGFVWLL